LGEYEGEFTEERPLLLELDLISRWHIMHAPRQSATDPISQQYALAGLEKITRLEPLPCKYGTDGLGLTNLERHVLT
jgi:hypothetical protein